LALLLPNKHAASGCPHEHSNKPTNHEQKKQSFSGPAVRGYHYNLPLLHSPIVFEIITQQERIRSYTKRGTSEVLMRAKYGCEPPIEYDQARAWTPIPYHNLGLVAPEGLLGQKRVKIGMERLRFSHPGQT
jgi:hypothetical protein